MKKTIALLFAAGLMLSACNAHQQEVAGAAVAGAIACSILC